MNWNKISRILRTAINEKGSVPENWVKEANELLASISRTKIEVGSDGNVKFIFLDEHSDNWNPDLSPAIELGKIRDCLIKSRELIRVEFLDKKIRDIANERFRAREEEIKLLTKQMYTLRREAYEAYKRAR